MRYIVIQIGDEYKIARRLKDGTLKILKKSYKSYREAKREADRRNKKAIKNGKIK